MPEGDTIHAVARLLAEELVGRELCALELRGRRPFEALAGLPIERVWAHGKNLFVAFGEEATLWTHLGMHGRWNRYRARERRGRALGSAVVRIATAPVVFECVGPKTAQVVRAADLPRHPELAGLGPDLVVPGVDLDAVVRRARERVARPPPPTVRELLLDQRVAAGIGNIFQSETLFLERLHPDADPRALDDARLAALYRRASALLIRNVGAVPRIFTASGRPDPHGNRTWVYGRDGRPCRACGEPIVRRAASASDRVTWWCPRCQPAPVRGASTGAERAR